MFFFLRFDDKSHDRLVYLCAACRLRNSEELVDEVTYGDGKEFETVEEEVRVWRFEVFPPRVSVPCCLRSSKRNPLSWVHHHSPSPRTCTSPGQKKANRVLVLVCSLLFGSPSHSSVLFSSLLSLCLSYFITVQ